MTSYLANTERREGYGAEGDASGDVDHLLDAKLADDDKEAKLQTSHNNGAQCHVVRIKQLHWFTAHLSGPETNTKKDIDRYPHDV